MCAANTLLLDIIDMKMKLAERLAEEADATHHIVSPETSTE
jgi:hypothetical protein